MGLSSKREAVLQAALSSAGFTVQERTTARMEHGDVTETTLWHLAGGGRTATLCLVTEVGLDTFFPPVLRVVAGHLPPDAARGAPGDELVWDDDVDLRRFVEAVKARAV